MTDRNPDNFLPRPVQEEGEQNMDATLKPVIDLLFRLIATRLVAVTCGVSSQVRRFFMFLLTSIYNVVNVKREIQAEKLTQFDNMKKTQEELSTKQRTVLHDYEKMKDKVKIAQETDYRISRNDDNELKRGLINASYDLDECQDVLDDVNVKFCDLLQGAKKAVAIKQVALAIVLLFTTVLTAGFFAVTYRCHVDTSVGLVIVTVQLLICRWKAQVYFSNQMLLTKCEEFLKYELQDAEKLQKQLKRDVDKRLPALKNLLVVLDIDVSLYASLRPHSE